MINDLTSDVASVEEARSIESFISSEGKMKARLTAPVMIRMASGKSSDTQYVEFPKSLHVDFYNDSLVKETRLDSKYGKYYETYNKVYLRDSVVVITLKGDTLKSPDLWWDQNLGIFYTDKYAEYRSKDQQVQGHKGLQATQDLKTVTFIEPTALLDVKSNGLTP
ncbi:LPS export ABC transporter periplasmic protein LptC [Terrimonas sp. NA20]|uniref:LPS export ABC transporter periplasmic protein LptC n=1 Tax=Terrimonas ginsenosidimutans TaxID=2908004 RepID=A0ABS9L038_9BACT|nr:LPS export ABC transporter periplasmic protein LptC [Terrimonas ginsenosidimutans]